MHMDQKKRKKNLDHQLGTDQNLEETSEQI